MEIKKYTVSRIFANITLKRKGACIYRVYAESRGLTEWYLRWSLFTWANNCGPCP